MKRLDQQLQRLLRAAAMAPQPTVQDLETGPCARDLLRQREQALARTEGATRLVLRAGLATACALLLVTLLVSVRQIDRANRDVFAVSELVLTRISTP